LLVVAVRTLILYLLAVTVIRVMGKRQIGELQPHELVITVIIAELVTIPMEDTGAPLLYGVVAVLVLLAAQIAMALLALHSERARTIICGTPSILIKDGRILEQELRRLRINVNDLLEQLRTKNFPNVADVAFAILETNGKLTVIPRPEQKPLTHKSMQIIPPAEDLPVTLIQDGKVLRNNLRTAGLELSQLEDMLRQKGIEAPERVFLAQLDSQGQLWVQEKAGAAGAGR